MKTIKKVIVLMVFAFSVHGFTGCGYPSYVTTGVHYVNPPWAPPYYQGVRYYYIPDIEVYYDLSDGYFVYLDGGEWLFAPTLPRIYASFDLYTAFVIALDAAVFQPWSHHQYYLSHYPRYYYRSFYHNTDIVTIRGFNENVKKPFTWRKEDRDRIDDIRKSGKADNPKIKNPPPPQPSGYYGKKIGQPVRVKPPMKEQKNKKKKVQNEKKTPSRPHQ